MYYFGIYVYSYINVYISMYNYRKYTLIYMYASYCVHIYMYTIYLFYIILFSQNFVRGLSGRFYQNLVMF